MLLRILIPARPYLPFPHPASVHHKSPQAPQPAMSLTRGQAIPYSPPYLGSGGVVGTRLRGARAESIIYQSFAEEADRAW